MNCLLTGVNGFLGKIISQHISKSNKLWGLSRSGADFNYSLEKEIPIFKLKFDLVVHSAGKAHSIPKTEFEKKEFHNVNVTGTSNLLKGLEKSQLPFQFVFISSVAVYGKETGNFICEEHSLLAKDPYGLSKIQAENLVQEWCNKHKIICTILRLPLLVGESPPGNLGAMIKGIKNGYYFNIAGGSAKKSMVLSEDVAKFILKVAEIGGIFNLTDGYHPSFAELSNHISFQLNRRKPRNMNLWLARLIANFGDLLGSKAPLNTNKLKKLTSDLTFDDSKARDEFGWNPSPVLTAIKINKNDQ